MKLEECRWIVDKWSERNDELSARLSAFDNPAYRADRLKVDVQSGKAAVCNLFSGKTHLGFLVYEIDGKELVVLALFIDPEIQKALNVAIPYIEKLAISNGCKSTRFNTSRPGLIIGCEKHGFKMSEIVMRKYHE